MNVGEYGSLLYFNVSEDISGATNTVKLMDPDGNESSHSATVGTSQYETDDGRIFAANQYATYTFQDGDIDEQGWWKARLESLENGVFQKTDWIRFKVRA